MKDDQTSLHGSIQPAGSIGGPPTNFETTFDVDGNVETISTHSSHMIQPKSVEPDQMSRKSDDLSRSSVKMEGRGRGCDAILPAVLEFKEDGMFIRAVLLLFSHFGKSILESRFCTIVGEDMFLSAVISQADTVHTQFKLAPTYTLYMAARYRASTHYRPEMTPNERAHRLTSLMNKVSSLIQLVVQVIVVFSILRCINFFNMVYKTHFNAFRIRKVTRVRLPFGWQIHRSSFTS